MGLLIGDQTAIIKSDLEEKGWSSYCYWKEHLTFNCSKNTLINFVNEIQETGSKEPKNGSGRKATAATSENEEK